MGPVRLALRCAIALSFMLNDAVVGTHVEFTASPTAVQYPVTASLSVRCALSTYTVTSVSPVTSSPGLVGRSIDTFKRSPSSEDIEHVMSITISRNNVIVSTITLFSQAQVETQLDLNNVKVSGDLNANSIEKGFLQLDWSFPQANQTGSYQCSISGVSGTSHQTVMIRDLEIKATTVDMDDMLSEIHDLKKMVLELRKQIDADRSEREKEMDPLTKELVRVSHAEQGVADCGGPSSSWTAEDYKAPWVSHGHFGRSKSVRVAFKTPFIKPPVVQLSIYSFYSDVKYEYYAAVVESVDTTGFNIRCLCWDDPQFVVKDMDISWLSVATA